MRKQLFLLLPVLLSQILHAQNDSLFSAPATKSRVAAAAGEPIYNGREHTGYDPVIEGIPYYLSADWQKGTLSFHDIQYRDLLLKYDLVAGEVVVQHLNGFTGVALFTPRVQAFTLGAHYFVNLRDNGQPSFKPGIYEQLASGRLTLFSKRSRLVSENIVSGVLEKKFVTNDSYYVLKDGVYYPIKNEKAMLGLVPEKKAEIKAWMKASGIKYKSNPEAALVKIVEYVNQSSR